MSHIKAELIKFGETTSIRGIPRIFKSKSFFLKAIWLFFVLACTGVLVFLLFTLFNNFYRWPTTTKFSEKLDGKIIFPDITICNMNPFGKGFPYEYTFNNFINDLKDMDNYDSNGEIGNFVDNFKTISGYIDTVIDPSDDFFKKNDCPKFIAECFVYSETWQYMNSCTSNFTSHWNTYYYKCDTFRTNDFIGSTKKIIKGMTLVLNIGPPINDSIPFSASLTTSQASGVRIAVHPRGTSPDFKRGISVGPGTESVIKITQTDVTRLDKPYNPLGCTTEKYMPNSNNLSYSRDICFQYCMQDLINKSCLCVASWYEIPYELNDFPLCDNLTYENKTMSEIIKNFNCAINVSKEENNCYDTGLFPCSETAYTSTIESSPWPPVSMQLDIYKTYIRNCSSPDVKKLYAIYDYYLQREENGSLTDEDETKKKSDFKLQESMLLVKFIIDKDYSYSESENPKYTWDVMISLVGGMLSLWLGITAMTAVELLEMFYFLARGCCEKRSPSP